MTPDHLRGCDLIAIRLDLLVDSHSQVLSMFMNRECALHLITPYWCNNLLCRPLDRFNRKFLMNIFMSRLIQGWNTCFLLYVLAIAKACSINLWSSYYRLVIGDLSDLGVSQKCLFVRLSLTCSSIYFAILCFVKLEVLGMFMSTLHCLNFQNRRCWGLF